MGKPKVRKPVDRTAWKAGFFTRLAELFEQYSKCFIVKVDNVGSKQMQQIRISLRGQAVIMMGKNTLVRKAMRGKLEQLPHLEKLMPYIRGNVGFVFTNQDLSEMREKILANRVAAPAKAGILAPLDVRIQAQNTGMPPEKTSFFQALNIATKINRGTIEILNDVHLIKQGVKVGASEAALLGMLKIMPFSYGLVIEQVFENGSVFTPDILDITNDYLLQRIADGVGNVASLALALHYPCMASITHMLSNGFKNLLAVAIESPYSFPTADKMKDLLKDPSKLAAAQAAAAAAAGGGAKKTDAKKEEKKEAPAAKKEEPKKKEPEPEEEDIGLSLFD